MSKQTWSFLKSFLPVSLTTCADTGGSTSIPRTYIPLACTICCAFVSFITSSISAAQQAANKVILATISHFLNNCRMKDKVYSLITIYFSCACVYRSLPGQGLISNKSKSFDKCRNWLNPKIMTTYTYLSKAAKMEHSNSNTSTPTCPLAIYVTHY